VLFNDFLGVLRGDMHVEGLFREHLDDRSLFAETETTGFDDLSTLLAADLLAFMDQVLVYLVGFGRFTAGTATDEYIMIVG
jgi:hypothetical protein